MHNVCPHMKVTLPTKEQASSPRASAWGNDVSWPRGKQKTVATLEQHDCRWPVGDPKGAAFHFCGERSLAGRPYCELHWRMAFQPPKPREARSVVIVPARRAA